MVCEHMHALVFAVVSASPTRQAQVKWKSRPWVAVIILAGRDTALKLGGSIS